MGKLALTISARKWVGNKVSWPFLQFPVPNPPILCVGPLSHSRCACSFSFHWSLFHQTCIYLWSCLFLMTMHVQCMHAHCGIVWLCDAHCGKPLAKVSIGVKEFSCSILLPSPGIVNSLFMAWGQLFTELSTWHCSWKKQAHTHLRCVGTTQHHLVKALHGLVVNVFFVFFSSPPSLLNMFYPW